MIMFTREEIQDQVMVTIDGVSTADTSAVTDHLYRLFDYVVREEGIDGLSHDQFWFAVEEAEKGRR